MAKLGISEDAKYGKSAIIGIIDQEILVCRHYKLEAEIASMTWRVMPSEICHVAQSKFRGSVHSLVRRGSQLVRLIFQLASYFNEIPVIPDDGIFSTETSKI